jgi:pimeloyl-ACP methyl ester carboxylesterase
MSSHIRIRLRPVDIAVDAQSIAGSLLTHPQAVPGVLFVHGWGGSQEQDLQRAREAAGLGCVCLTFDLRGHSRSKAQYETVTREDNLRDLLAAYDLLAGQPSVEKSAIAVVGNSYGAYLAAILTSLRPVCWLALRSPALYRDEGWDLPKRQLNRDPDLLAYRRQRVSAEENRALRACAEFQGDVLIIESEHDELIPHAVVLNHIASLVNSRSITHRIISGADHALSREVDQRACSSILMNWFAEMIIGARGDAAAQVTEIGARG